MIIIMIIMFIVTNIVTLITQKETVELQATA